MTGPGLSSDELPVDISALLANLADYHHHQLSTVNLEAAKWKAAAHGVRAELAELRARVAELEARHPLGQPDTYEEDGG